MAKSNTNTNAIASLNITIGANADMASVAASVKQITSAVNSGLKGKNPVINPQIDIKDLQKQLSQVQKIRDKVFAFGLKEGMVGLNGRAKKGWSGTESLKNFKTSIKDLDKVIQKYQGIIQGLQAIEDKRKAEEKELDRLIKAEEKERKEAERLAKAKEREAIRQEKETQKRERIGERSRIKVPQGRYNGYAYDYRYSNKSAYESASVFAPHHPDVTGHKIDKEYEAWWLSALQKREDIQSRQANKRHFSSINEAIRTQNRLYQQGNIEIERQLLATKKLTGQFGQLGVMARQFFNIWAIKSYAENMVKITAEFDMQRRALGSLIGDQTQAITMFNQIKNMALESPFTALELNKSAKQLAAYSIEAKDLVKTTKMLGDISAATGVEISRLILAYGQVKSAHYLRGQEVRQFTEAGVPLIDALSRHYSVKERKNVSANDVMKRISERGVAFTDVKEVLETMTEEGGRFYNFQYEIAQTTYGKMQKFQDALQQGWARLGNETQGVFNKVLDIGVNIAKNMSGYIKILGTAITAWTIWNQKKRVGLAITRKEETLMNRQIAFSQMQGVYQRMGNPTLANYYGAKSVKAGEELTKIMRLRDAWRSVGTNIKIAAAQASGLNKVTRVIGVSIKGLTVGVRLLGAAFKTVLIESGIGIALVLIGSLIGKIMSARDAVKQLDNDLKEIDTETLKKSSEAGKRFNELATEATKAADGTAKQEQALSKLNELYGEVLPKEMLRIGYLKQMNGQYELLTNRLKAYYRVQALEQKKATIRENDKYVKSFKKNISFGSTDLTQDQNRLLNGLAMSEAVENRLKAGLIIDAQSYTEALKEILSQNRDAIFSAIQKGGKRYDGGTPLSEEGIAYRTDDIINNPEKYLLFTIPTEYFDKIKELNEEQRKINKDLYGEKGALGIEALDKYIKKQEEELNNFKTGNDLITARDRIVDSVAKQLVKSLDVQIDKNKILEYLRGEINAEDALSVANIEKGTDAYNQTLQTMDSMKSAFVGLWDGADMFSERSNKVLDIWKDSYITIANIKDLLDIGDETSVKTFDALKAKKDEGKAFVEKIKNQPILQERYGIDAARVTKLLNIRTKEDAKAYQEQYLKKIGPKIGGPNDWDKMETQLLEYFLEGYVDDEKKKSSSSGKSAIEQQKEAMNEWVAMWTKAKQDYEEMREMFAADKAQEQMWKMWESQFGHIQENIQNVLGRTFNKEDFFSAIEDNYSFTELINEYIDYVRAAINKVTTQKDKSVLSDFLYNTLIPKITDAERREIERGYKGFIKNIDYILEHTKARIDLYDKIFKTTGDSMMAYNIASAFNDKGSLNRLKESREMLELLIEEAFGKGESLNGKSWKELYDKAESMPTQMKDEYLKVLREMRSGTEELIEKGLQGYEKMLSIEEKQMMAFSEYTRNVKNATENITDEVTRNAVIKGLERMYNQTILDLQMESIKSSQFYIDLFNNIQTAGIGSLQAMRRQLVALSKESGLSARELKTLQDEIKKIDDRLKPKRYKITDIIKLPTKKEMRGLLDKIVKAEKEYEDRLNDAREKRRILDETTERYSNGEATYSDLTDARENSSMATEIAEKAREALDGLNIELEEVESKHTKAWLYIKSILDEYANSLKGIGDIGNSVLGVMNNFSKMVSGTESARITAGLNAWNEAVSSIQNGVNSIENLGSSISGITDKISKIREAQVNYEKAVGTEAQDIAKSAMVGAMATGYGAIAVAAIEASVGIYKMGQAIHDANIQKRIEKVQDQIDGLEKSLIGINNIMKRLAGNSYYRKQAEQVEVYRKQLTLAQQQLQMEREKSKGGDKDTIKQYTKTIDEYKQKVIDTQDQLFQAFLGSDVNGYLKGIVDTFAQARIQGENTFNALKKSFGEMITSMIEDTIMSSIIQKRFEGVFDAIRQASDKGSLSTTDVSRISASGMQAIQDANNDLTAMFPLIESMRNMFGVSSSVAGSYGSAVQGMSEQTAGTLGGYMGAILDQINVQAKDVSLIREYVSMMAQGGQNTGSAMMSAYQTQTLNHLMGIQANTLRNADKVEQMYNLLASMRTVNNSGSGSVYGWQIVQD